MVFCFSFFVLALFVFFFILLCFVCFFLVCQLFFFFYFSVFHYLFHMSRFQFLILNFRALYMYFFINIAKNFIIFLLLLKILHQNRLQCLVPDCQRLIERGSVPHATTSRTHRIYPISYFVKKIFNFYIGYKKEDSCSQKSSFITKYIDFQVWRKTTNIYQR